MPAPDAPTDVVAPDRIDRRLIEVSLLTPEERTQMDAYHARVLKVVGPRVPAEVRTWMEEACAPL